MTFPVTQQTQQDALNQVVRTAISLKNFCENANVTMQAQIVSANQILQIMFHVQEAINIWNKASTVQGIGQYAKDQFNDPALDIAAEFSNMVTTAQNVINWIATNFPTDASGYILKDKIVNGSLEVRQFTPAQTAGLRTEIDSLINTIG